MGIFEKRQFLGGLNVIRKALVPPRPKKSANPLPASSGGFFGTKKERARIEMKRHFLKSSPRITDTWGGVKFTRKQREGLVDKSFPEKRFKGYVSEKEAKTRLKELKKQELWARTPKEKVEVGRQRKYLEETLGLKGRY